MISYNKKILGDQKKLPEPVGTEYSDSTRFRITIHEVVIKD